MARQSLAHQLLSYGLKPQLVEEARQARQETRQEAQLAAREQEREAEWQAQTAIAQAAVREQSLALLSAKLISAGLQLGARRGPGASSDERAIERTALEWQIDLAALGLSALEATDLRTSYQTGLTTGIVKYQQEHRERRVSLIRVIVGAILIILLLAIGQYFNQDVNHQVVSNLDGEVERFPFLIIFGGIVIGGVGAAIAGKYKRHHHRLVWTLVWLITFSWLGVSIYGYITSNSHERQLENHAVSTTLRTVTNLEKPYIARHGQPSVDLNSLLVGPQAPAERAEITSPHFRITFQSSLTNKLLITVRYQGSLGNNQQTSTTIDFPG